MYHHFAGKQELAVTALEASAAAMRSDVEALLDVKRPAMERLIAYLERQRDSLRGCRMGRMTYDADVLATPELLAPVSRTLGWLVDTIAEVIRQGIDAQESRGLGDVYKRTERRAVMLHGTGPKTMYAPRGRRPVA